VLTVGITSPANASNLQWYLSSLQISRALQISQGAGVVLAEIDTGVDSSHPDLAGSVLPGVDLLNPPLSTDGRADADGHGTRMAGLIVGHGHVQGIAPKVQLLPVRAVGGDESLGAQIPDGIEWAISHGAKVINISASGPVDYLAEDDALKDAIAADVVVVAGAGNGSGGSIQYPAAYPGVVAVTGTDEHGNSAPISSIGPQAVIAAPAVDIYSTEPHGQYGYATGTSDATAIVSGVVALIRSKYPNLSAADVIHRLTATADDKGAPGRDPQYGFGIVDPVKALTADVPLLSPSPSQSAAAPATPSNTNWTRIVLLGLSGLLALLLAAAVFTSRRRQRAEP
jgi:type VII secretion-associated serine protease mycosin